MRAANQRPIVALGTVLALLSLTGCATAGRQTVTGFGQAGPLGDLPILPAG